MSTALKACKDCPNRKKACHDTCEKHKAEVEDLHRRKAYMQRYRDRYQKSSVAYARAINAYLYKKAKQNRM